MKNKLFVTVFIFTLFSCERIELPDITDKGNNTFGMLVNGEVWTPFSLNIMSGPVSLSGIYYSNSSILSIVAYNSLREESVHLYFPNIIEPGNYYLDCGVEIPDSVSVFENCFTRFYKNINSDNKLENNFVLVNKSESNLHLTKLDTIKKIVSGTFSVNLHNFKGDILEITKGRFDVKINISYL